MHLTRIGKTLCAGLLAVSMMLPGITAFADDVPTMTETGSLIKIVNTSGDGIKYSDYSYTINFTQGDKETDSASGESINDVTVGLGPVTVGNVSQTLTVSTNNVQTEHTGQWVLTTTKELDLSGFDTPGIYTYTVTMTDSNTPPSGLETINANDSTKWVASRAEYLLRVYVENLGDRLEKTVTLEQTKDQNGTAKSGDTNDNKVQSLEFDNNYCKSTFSLTKKVDGKEQEPDEAKTDGYKFTFSKHSNSSINMPSSVTYYVKSANGTVTGPTTVSVGTKGVDISLKADETVIFVNLPTGMNIKASEDKSQASDTYGVKKIKTEEWKGTSYTKKDPGAVSSSNTKNDEVDVEGTVFIFTNIYEQNMIVTGVVTDIAPYITLVVIAIAGIAAYIIIRKRMR